MKTNRSERRARRVHAPVAQEPVPGGGARGYTAAERRALKRRQCALFAPEEDVDAKDRRAV